MTDTKLQAFKDTLPADEAAELDRVLAFDWPDGLSMELHARKLVSPLVRWPTHSVVIQRVRENGWRYTVAAYRLNNAKLEDILKRAVETSKKLRQIEDLTDKTRRGIEEAIGVSPRLAEVG